MRIVVIQRHVENLEGIKACVRRINPERAEEIIFSSDPHEVVRIVSDGNPTLVVSGQVLGQRRYGTALAWDVKQANPQTLFFIYSIMPERSACIDGIIPKQTGTMVNPDHRLLARILASHLEGATRESLRSAFPEIY